VSFPTWEHLSQYYCAREYKNPYFEKFACRRYNSSSATDRSACRLVFLKAVLEDPVNKTLCRNGRFIWCKNFRYEGRTAGGLRQISFTVDKGNKRFQISENNILCIPSKVYISNNHYFRPKATTFAGFSTVFSYRHVLTSMVRNSSLERDELLHLLEADNPYKPGSLVVPRLGYFHPYSTVLASIKEPRAEHPCGIILGKTFVKDDCVSKELYRVRFGSTTYERVHPIQMEIINEV
jgi:hypothetical protein